MSKMDESAQWKGDWALDCQNTELTSRMEDFADSEKFQSI